MLSKKKTLEKLLAKGDSLVSYLCLSKRMRQKIIAASLQTSAAGSAGNSQRPEVNFLLIRAQSILPCPSLGISRQFGLAKQRAKGGNRHSVTRLWWRQLITPPGKLLQPGHGKFDQQ